VGIKEMLSFKKAKLNLGLPWKLLVLFYVTRF